jgi:hypothetical protein
MMKRFKLFGVTLAALFMLGVAVATSALALPDVSLTLIGSAFPLNLKANQPKAKTDLSNVIGEKLEGEGVLLRLDLTALGHLGTFELLFTKIKQGTESCHSEEGGSADPAGEVLMKGSWHVVYTSLLGTPALALGLLLLFTPLTLICGSKSIQLRGDTLMSVTSSSIGSEASELTAVGDVLEGNGAGAPNLSTYYNEGGTAVKAKLEANFGSGFKGGAWEIHEVVTSTAEGSNMFVITSR